MYMKMNFLKILDRSHHQGAIDLEIDLHHQATKEVKGHNHQLIEEVRDHNHQVI